MTTIELRASAALRRGGMIQGRWQGGGSMGAFRSVPLVLLTLLASAFSITQASAQESIKIGVLTIRSGPATPVGDDILAGIETATKMSGPLLGRSVELIVEESQWNAQ